MAIQKPVIFDEHLQRLADADSLGLTDDSKLYLGLGNDVSIVHNGTKWVFDVEAATDLITMNPDGDDTDFVFGSSQLDSTGAALQHRRMFFDKNKAAFRAGFAESTYWNAASVGNFSAAFGSNCVASGVYSLASGNFTTASGQLSVALGSYNQATATFAISLGQHSTANKHGQLAHGSGCFAVSGDSQGSFFIARKSVTHSDAAWYELFLDNVDDQLTLASDTAWIFDILIIGTTSGCTKTFGFKIEGVIKNDGGTTTILASTVTTLYDGDDTDFDARVTADDATDALKIEVTDATSGGDTVRWVAKVSTVEVTY